MVSLESDKTYRLTPVSAVSGDDGKLYIHVKFTDSSFKAIEECAKVAKKLNIDFVGDQGHFDVPTSDNSSGGIRRFQFGLAPCSEGSSSSFECFQQKKMSDNLTAFGAFARRLTVKAQEDVFDATRERMAAVVEESEKNRAREISTTNSNALKGGSRRATSLGQSAVSRPSAAGSAASQATTAASLFDAASLAKRKAAERMSSMQQQSTTPGGSSSATSGSSSSTHKTPTSQQQPREQLHSLRERILYSLAVKPQSESQLINALKLPTREAIELSTIVKQLCYPLNPSNSSGVFQLRREAFGDIKFDHPLVSSHEDKMAIRRNANASATSSSNLATTTSAQQQKLQRPSPNNTESIVPPKMRKLEETASPQNIKQQQQQQQKAPTSSSMGPVNNRTRPAVVTAVATASSNTTTTAVNSNKINGIAKALPTTTSTTSNRFSSSPNKDSNSCLMDADFGHRAHDSGSVSGFGVASAGSSSCSPEVPVIENREQRTAMKADFMNKYGEYRKLHDTLSEKTAYFREMRPQLDACQQGSEQYQKLEEAIRDAYVKLEKDESYVAAKRKLEELHETLARIKQAIEDYDVANASGVVPSSGTSSGGSQPQSSSSTSSSPAVNSTSSIL